MFSLRQWPLTKIVVWAMSQLLCDFNFLWCKLSTLWSLLLHIADHIVAPKGCVKLNKLTKYIMGLAIGITLLIAKTLNFADSGTRWRDPVCSLRPEIGDRRLLSLVAELCASGPLLTSPSSTPITSQLSWWASRLGVNQFPSLYTFNKRLFCDDIVGFCLLPTTTWQNPF